MNTNNPCSLSYSWTGIVALGVEAQWNYFHDKVGNTETQIQWAPVGKPPDFTEP
ncbi:MAG: hypothetical protein WB696_25035 [Chthoniobacterales bacterium]|jgi:hypothetical protein